MRKVICVDDTNPNPLCRFPCGYVVRGHVYVVRGTTLVGGVQIEGLPVFHYLHSNADVGWQPRRFCKFDERSPNDEIGDSLEMELVAAGSGH